MLGKFFLPSLLHPNFFSLQWHVGISPREGWISMISLSSLRICPRQHSSDFFPNCSEMDWGRFVATRLHSPCQGLPAYYQVDRWARLLLGSLVYGAGFHSNHKDAFVLGWMSNSLLKKDKKEEHLTP